MIQYNLRLPSEMKNQIELVCESGAFGRTPVSQFIRTAITEKLQQYPMHEIKAKKAAAERAAKREAAKQSGGDQ